MRALTTTTYPRATDPPGWVFKPQATSQPQVIPPAKPEGPTVKATQKQKDEIYAQLLNVTDIENLDKKTFAEQVGIDNFTLSGLITTARKQPSIYIKLRKEGFTDQQVPTWYARPIPADPNASPPPAPPVPTPAGQPAIATLGQEKAAGQAGQGTSRGLQKTEDTLQNATAAAFTQANKQLASSGQRVDALGGDALQQWIREANIQEIGGVYYQRAHVDGLGFDVLPRQQHRSRKWWCL